MGKSGLRYLEIFEFVAPNNLLKLVLCLEKNLLLLYFWWQLISCRSGWFVQFELDVEERFGSLFPRARFVEGDGVHRAKNIAAKRKKLRKLAKNIEKLAV